PLIHSMKTADLPGGSVSVEVGHGSPKVSIYMQIEDEIGLDELEELAKSLAEGADEIRRAGTVAHDLHCKVASEVLEVEVDVPLADEVNRVRLYQEAGRWVAPDERSRSGRWFALDEGIRSGWFNEDGSHPAKGTTINREWEARP